jgi:hypothetical protein
MERNTLNREAAWYSGNERNVWIHVCDCDCTSSAGILESDFLIVERRARFAVVSADVMFAVSWTAMILDVGGQENRRGYPTAIESGDRDR